MGPSSYARGGRDIWLAAALGLVFFWKLAFTNLILARGDTFLYFYPYWDYRIQSVSTGQLPLWNPYLFMGAPFLANSQAGVLYPLNWPFVFLAAPLAVKGSILLHVGLLAVGTYLFAWQALDQRRWGALLSALLCALGGYVTAQVEHVNQLQALAWFPWLLWAVHSAFHDTRPARGWPPTAKAMLYAGLVVALQLLAGHTQSVFISLTGAGLYAAVLAVQQAPPFWDFRLRALGRAFAFILGCAVLAAALSAAQFLPTLELASQSLRGGGLPLREALSFSLDPRLAGRALLPGYSRTIFSEFVAYPGVIGLALLAAGLNRKPARLALAALVVAGLAFALGAYNPLYALLAAVPPFNLFRVPARWLFLFAFGAAILAGHGLDELEQRRRRIFFVPALVLLIAPLADVITPAGETGPLGAPAQIDLGGWLTALVVLIIVAYLPRIRRQRAPILYVFAAVELFLAAQALPFNHLTTPEAYSSVRPAMTQLLAAPADADGPGDRFLSMSALRFDPGDLAELRGELDPQLPPNAVYDAIVAAKHKEVLSPNLPLTWRLAAVDGFDGGILPLKHWAEFTQLFTGAPALDGRLRENVRAAADPRLLSLANARYLITDKVDDAWLDDVFYDLQFTVILAEGETSSIAHVPPFQATTIGLVASAPSGQVLVTLEDGRSAELPVTAEALSGSSVYRLHLRRPARPVTITLVGPMTARGLSLIDERSGAFQSLTLGRFRLLHSGDVKVYANLDALPRAFVAPNAVSAADAAEARAYLADPAFDPASTVVLMGQAVPPAGDEPAVGGAPAKIALYTPDRVRVSADGPGYLVLTDAFYPGWIATLDGAPAPILRADIMFRAVKLPPGTHIVDFRFEPASLRIGLWVSGIVFVVVVAGLWWLEDK